MMIIMTSLLDEDIEAERKYLEEKNTSILSYTLLKHRTPRFRTVTVNKDACPSTLIGTNELVHKLIVLHVFLVIAFSSV